jgi:peptidoglycan/xylan/chitin deacetylase (PgdA/CDA1 family)
MTPETRMLDAMKRILLSFMTYRQAEFYKTLLCHALYFSGVAFIAGLWRPRGAAVLLYHSVAPRGVFHDNRMSLEDFEAQVRFLKRKFEIVPMSRVLECLRKKRPVPRKWIVLTFDDGYKDNAGPALSVLRKNQAPASFYAVTDVVKGGKTFFYDDIQDILDRVPEKEVAVVLNGHPKKFVLSGKNRKDDAALRMVLAVRQRHERERAAFVEHLRAACRMPRRSEGAEAPSLYMTESDVRALDAAGMEVGSHTHSHANLAAVPPEDFQTEIFESKRDLETCLGKPVLGFAYPFGKRRNFNDRVKKAVGEAGYGYAVTTEFGRVTQDSDLYALPRIAAPASLVRLKVNLMGIPL